jgi:hypothetical protein
VTAARALPLAALGLAAALAAGAAEANDPPLCEATVALEPEQAHPGEQVRFRLRLLVRGDVGAAAWDEPPSFPGLRAERLAPRPAAAGVERDGAVYEIREEARALFADRPGRALIPPAQLVCRSRAGVSERVATPEVALLVLPFPEAERPADFGGLTGPLSVRRSVKPERVALGQSIRLGVTLQGAGNLWDASEPQLASLAREAVEVFPRPSQVELDRGEELLVRRHFAFDLVPRREGVLRIPALAWRYFDPAAERYALAAAEPLEVVVGPPAPAAGAPAERGDLAPRAIERPESPRAGWRAAALAAGAALLAALAAGAWRAQRRRRANAKRVAAALARADRARAAGDRDGELAGLAHAVRAALATRIGAAAEGPPEAAPRAGLAPAAGAALELLAALERARFDPTAAAPERAAVLRALASLSARRPLGPAP